MNNYAIVNIDGLITNMILWDGSTEWSPEPGFIAVKAEENWAIGGTVLDGVYTAPPVKEITKEEYVAMANALKSSLYADATKAIAPLSDAVELDMATDEEIALLSKWRKYRVLLNRIDTSTAPDITWPELPV